MVNKKKILFVCTGNSCRSQIAHGLMNEFAGEKFEIYSAGFSPSKVHPMAIKVMNEIDIDISNHTSDHLDDYLTQNIDIVITTCDNASESCPVFPGQTMKYHWNIEDPFESWNINDSNIYLFRKTRDKIEKNIKSFLKKSEIRSHL